MNGVTFSFKAKLVITFKGMIIFANLTIGGFPSPSSIANSNDLDPTDFTGGMAGQFRIHSGVDQINALKILGDNLVIYSTDHIVNAQFVGDPLVFVFRTAASQGPVAGKSVVDFGDFHEFLGRDTQHLYDGVAVQDVNMHIWRGIVELWDEVRISQAYTFQNHDDGEIYWVIPLLSDSGAGTVTSPPAIGYSEHYLEQPDERRPRPFGVRQLPFTSMGLYTARTGSVYANPLIIVGNSSGQLFTLNSSHNANGSALTSYVRFPRRPTVDGKMRALVTRIYPFTDTRTGSLVVSTFMSDDADKTLTITQADNFPLAFTESTFFVTPYRRGRYMSVQFGTAGPSQPWVLLGYDYEARKGGKR